MSKKKISPDDKATFRDAMSDVTPLQKDNKVPRHRTPPSLKVKQQRYETKPEINLSSYVSEPVAAETILSFQQNPIPKKRMLSLIRGDIPRQGKLDLHGYRRDEAQSKLLPYLTQSRQQGKRCILIIHGKGNYHHEPPLIKNLVNIWLQQHPDVIAFHSAQPKDGGTGAVYVLLKR